MHSCTDLVDLEGSLRTEFESSAMRESRYSELSFAKILAGCEINLLAAAVPPAFDRFPWDGVRPNE
jgi:hypothetical protein